MLYEVITPLIMVVAFVGFVGGWTREIFGSGALFAAGLAATLVVTFFTFLPSFVFIFAGAPFVETTHGNLRFTAPLSAITAAVVGVVLNLALFFAYHVLWPRGFDGGLDCVITSYSIHYTKLYECSGRAASMAGSTGSQR